MTDALSLPFEVPVPTGGYAWWYIDVLGDDGFHSATLIFFVGNPFSPFYLRALRSGQHPPAECHAAVNVVLYRGRRKLWTFDEHEGCRRDGTQLAVGGSTLRLRDDSTVEARFEARSPLLGAPLRGVLRLDPSAFHHQPHWLDERQQHRWHPIVPCGRAEVLLEQPRIRFSGRAYFDGNQGTEPFAAGLKNWTWMRALAADGSVDVIYDTVDLAGTEQRYTRAFLGSGAAEPIDLPRVIKLPRTRWLLARRTRLGDGERVCGLRTVESAPFYARTILTLERGGVQRQAMHEVMDLRRFRCSLVQAAFYLRMRRAGPPPARPRLGLWARLIGSCCRS